MKKSLFSYMIYVKDPPPLNVLINDIVLTHTHEKEEGNLNEETSKLDEFLKSNDSCFVDTIPNELPPPLGVLSLVYN